MDYLSIVLCLLSAWITIHLLSRTRYTKPKSTKLPPGPYPLPIFGNLFSLGSKPHCSLANLARTYGPLMTLQLGQIPTIIISSASVAKEALQKNDISFSTRNVVDAACALKHHENSVAWLPANSQWRNLRKICNSQVFSTRRLEDSQKIRRDKVKQLLSYVEKCSEAQEAIDMGQAAFSTALNLLSSTFFSMDIGDPTSESARQFRDTIRGIMEEAGKPNFADYFPFLKMIDPQGIKRRMSVHFQTMIDLFKTLIDERIQGSVTRPLGSIQAGYDVVDVLLSTNQEKTEEIDIPHLLLDFLAAGADSTSTTLEWAMAELLHNPVKLQKAKMELRKVIGVGNQVQESDMDRLPYLQAVIKETLRLHPSVPLSVPRKADMDIRVFGFTIPKNAQVLVNIWAIGRDPAVWERPNKFEPERFIGSGIGVDGRDFEVIPFGTGSRVCPGWAMAIRMLHLMLGSLIHGFKWEIEGGVLPKEMDMEEKLKFTLEKAKRLSAIPVRA